MKPHPHERLEEMKDALARLAVEGDMRIIDTMLRRRSWL